MHLTITKENILHAIDWAKQADMKPFGTLVPIGNKQAMHIQDTFGSDVQDFEYELGTGGYKHTEDCGTACCVAGAAILDACEEEIDGYTLAYLAEALADKLCWQADPKLTALGRTMWNPGAMPEDFIELRNKLPEFSLDIGV